jgi:hypothetical protein
MNLKKKFLEKRENDPPSLGNFINWHFQQNKIKKKSISDFLGVIPTTLNGYFKQSSFQFAILWRISQAAQYNFLMDLGERLAIPYETEKEKELTAQIENLKQENSHLKRENTLLRDIVKR